MLSNLLQVSCACLAGFQLDIHSEGTVVDIDCKDGWISIHIDKFRDGTLRTCTIFRLHLSREAHKQSYVPDRIHRLVQVSCLGFAYYCLRCLYY
jgi:hypothetical protein